jgi:hypothetical protein
VKTIKAIDFIERNQKLERAKGIEPSSRFTVLKAFKINGLMLSRTNIFELFILTFILTLWQAL